MKVNRIKLAKLLLKFGSISTDKGELNYEGDLEVGLEVFVEGEGGELVVAEDGDYVADGQTIVVVDGKIAEIKEVEAEPVVEPVEAEEVVVEEAPVEDEKDAKIKELETKLAEAEAKIAELEAKLAEQEVKFSKQKETKPAHIEIKAEKVISTKELKENPALKYFKA